MKHSHWSEKHPVLYLCASPLSAIVLLASWFIFILAFNLLEVVWKSCSELAELFAAFFRTFSTAWRAL